ncbi:unnamed protein product [Brassica napus]|uniref:(rape) hypothetical protein n=1 Tax=Brassica napus TaxID=3708 RepID=A0A816P706_BRANA|nr:unnamed protein product [Brassica napus]
METVAACEVFQPIFGAMTSLEVGACARVPAPVSFNGLFDTEISCGPLYAIEYGTQFCFWLVKGYGGRCWEVV